MRHTQFEMRTYQLEDSSVVPYSHTYFTRVTTYNALVVSARTTHQFSDQLIMLEYKGTFAIIIGLADLPTGMVGNDNHEPTNYRWSNLEPL
jgi:hypothetical protein